MAATPGHEQGAQHQSTSFRTSLNSRPAHELAVLLRGELLDLLRLVLLAGEGHVHHAHVGLEHQVVELLAHALEAVEGDAAHQVARVAGDGAHLVAVARRAAPARPAPSRGAACRAGATWSRRTPLRGGHPLLQRGELARAACVRALHHRAAPSGPAAPRVRRGARAAARAPRYSWRMASSPPIGGVGVVRAPAASVAAEPVELLLQGLPARVLLGLDLLEERLLVLRGVLALRRGCRPPTSRSRRASRSCSAARSRA